MKNVLVTGSSRGIGEAIARAFYKNGYNVLINYNLSEQKAQALATELNTVAYKADVSKYDQVKNMFDSIEKKFGSVDILVNNAGIAPLQSVFQEVSEQTFDKTVNVNLKGMFNCCKCAVGGMINKGGGKIINISSCWGQIGGSCEVVYSMTKAGVIGFTKALADELAPSNICVNAVAPGFINTDMNAHLSQAEKDDFASGIPLGRIGTPQEVACAVLFLADEKSSYITGQIIGVNGGLC